MIKCSSISVKQLQFINLPRHDAILQPAMLAAIGNLFQRGQFIGGEEVQELEKELAVYLDIKHCVTVGSGTEALTLALRALHLPQQSEVITTPFTFIGTAEAIINAGLRPVFVDIDEQSYTIDPRCVESAITERTKVILPVHLYGKPANMQALLQIATKNNLIIIEDCAQAIGASIQEKKVGTFGTFGCFSFYPTKNLGAYGDGGLVTTNDCELAQRIIQLRNHGLDHERISHTIGTTSRLDSIQAAIVRIKLPQLDALNKRRRQLAQRYRDILQDIPEITLPQEKPEEYEVYHQYTIRVRVRDALRSALRSQNIPSEIYYAAPLHEHPAFAQHDYAHQNLSHAENAAREVLSLPISPEHTDEEIDQVAQAIRSFFNEYNF